MEDSVKELEVAEPIEVEEVSTNEKDSDEVEFTDSSNNEENSNIVDDGNEESNDTELNSKETSKESVKQAQSKEENAKFAKQRREKEERDKEIQDAYKRGKLEAFKGKMNPFTNTPIKDETDIEMYEAMCKLESEGKDPLSDYAEYVANEKREKIKQDQKEKEIQEQAKKDVEEFTLKYPKINLSELLEDETFKDYIEGKNKSLVTLYDNFLKLQNKFRTDSMKQAENAIANTISTPGSLNNQSTNTVDYASMSREEFLKIVEQVKNGE